MLDTPTDRRFFMTDSVAGVVELAKGITSKQSPCVVMESDVSGGGPIARPLMIYPIYFFVKAEQMADGDTAALAKIEAMEHARNFLAWLKYKHDEQVDVDRDGDFARLDLDGHIDYQTIGPLENGWYAVLVQMEREEPLNLCIDEDLYVDEKCDCED